jgi:hypothetical protein
VKLFSITPYAGSLRGSPSRPGHISSVTGVRPLLRLVLPTVLLVALIVALHARSRPEPGVGRRPLSLDAWPPVPRAPVPGAPAGTGAPLTDTR